jgi:hypothetical protein
MLENLYRDETTVPIVAERFVAFHGFLAASADALMAGRGMHGDTRRRVRAVLGHAVAFSTWRSLVREQGLSDAEAAAALCALVAAVAAG